MGSIRASCRSIAQPASDGFPYDPAISSGSKPSSSARRSPRPRRNSAKKRQSPTELGFTDDTSLERVRRFAAFRLLKIRSEFWPTSAAGGLQHSPTISQRTRNGARRLSPRTRYRAGQGRLRRSERVRSRSDVKRSRKRPHSISVSRTQATAMRLSGFRRRCLQTR